MLSYKCKNGGINSLLQNKKESLMLSYENERVAEATRKK